MDVLDDVPPPFNEVQNAPESAPSLFDTGHDLANQSTMLHQSQSIRDADRNPFEQPPVPATIELYPDLVQQVTEQVIRNLQASGNMTATSTQPTNTSHGLEGFTPQGDFQFYHATAKQTRKFRQSFENKQKATFVYLGSDYFDDLDAAGKSLDEIRMRCIRDWKFDPEGIRMRPTSVALKSCEETSDSCDSDGDKDDTIYRQIREILFRFQHDDTRDRLVSGLIRDSRKRKDVRAWARLLRYGYTTLYNKNMFLHKDRTKLPPRPRRKKPESAESVSHGALASPNVSSRCTAFDNINSGIWEPRYDNNGYSSASSNASAASRFSQSSAGSKKRRLPKDEGGYLCEHTGYNKVFDRACDLSHHKRNHQDEWELPQVFSMCSKRFLWPKDLRRHERTHRRRDGLLYYSKSPNET